MEGLLTNPSSSGWGYHAATAITILGHRSLSVGDRTQPTVRFKPKNLRPAEQRPGEPVEPHSPYLRLATSSPPTYTGNTITSNQDNLRPATCDLLPSHPLKLPHLLLQHFTIFIFHKREKNSKVILRSGIN